MDGTASNPGAGDGGFAGAMLWCKGLGALPGHRPLAELVVTLAATAQPRRARGARAVRLSSSLAPGWLNGASSIPGRCRQDKSLCRMMLTTALLYSVVMAHAHIC